ncbi:MAG: aldehyde dehydrogenase family protein [Microbacterium sp.]|uniref:aldehyde dehydrogenase family protein n=1 Tax=Microbacterium sp. TaxID=51671 RepID=UPI003BAE429D
MYIDGQWVAPSGTDLIPVLNPANEQVVGAVPAGTGEDVDRAVEAARRAFETFSQTTVDERLTLLRNILAIYRLREHEMAEVIRREVGSPWELAINAQAGLGRLHLDWAIDTLESYRFEEVINETTVRAEPIGVCGLITPWNWPMNQISAKVSYAIAAGCTMVLKPSELAPLNAVLFAEVLHEAGVPAGVFNLVHGDGPTVGHAIAAHPDIDMVSFTGSTRGGVEVARAAAPGVKRVAQELGGKSANIILEGTDLEHAVRHDVFLMMHNTGQSCDASTRMIVPEHLMDDVLEIAARAARDNTVGDPQDDTSILGPLISQAQFDRVQDLIRAGIAEGAELVEGGLGRPEGLTEGYYARPTIFGRVTNDMTIAREEIFGPVLCVIGYSSVEEAIAIANDSEYGLAGRVWGPDIEQVRSVARKMRTGMVALNGSTEDGHTPFGGYKKSGNGREMGAYGLREYLEFKSIFGDAAISR